MRGRRRKQLLHELEEKRTHKTELSSELALEEATDLPHDKLCIEGILNNSDLLTF